MSNERLDERLRSGLRPPHASPHDVDDALGTVVARVNRRRRVRRVGGVAVVALLLIAAVFLLPELRSTRQSHPAPAVHPTLTPTHPVTGAPGFPAPAKPTSIDGLTWRTPIMSEKARKQALRVTGLERYGHRVFQATGMRGNAEWLFIQNGQIRFRPGVLQNLGEGPYVTGTYTTTGGLLTMRLNSWPGTTRFRWHVTEDGTLTLRFVDTTLGPRYGAPAEVFLRMSLTASPFIRQDGY